MSPTTIGPGPTHAISSGRDPIIDTPPKHADQTRDSGDRRELSAWWLVLTIVVVGAIWFIAQPSPGQPFEDYQADGYQLALAAARESGRPILLIFTAPGCPPCQEMRRSVWPDDRIKALQAERYLTVTVDADSSAGAELCQRYIVIGTPMVIVIDAHENLIGRWGGLMNVQQMLSFLNTAADVLADPMNAADNPMPDQHVTGDQDKGVS